MWILRWPTALLLLALVLVCLVGAGVVTAARLDVAQLAAVSDTAEQYGKANTWLQAGLMYGAALMFFIALVRLLRRTQGFWFWLLGFALFGASWALSHNVRDWASLVQQTPRFDTLNAANAPEIGAQAINQGLAPLALCILAGLLVGVIDGADRAHWDRQGQ